MTVQDEAKFTRDDWSIHNKPLVILAAIVIAGACFAAGTFFGHIGNDVSTTGIRFSGSRQVMGARYGFGGYSFGGNGQDRVDGVITALDGSSIVVAGDGTTKTVATTSSTQYGTDPTPKVDDSIMAFGSTSNGVFTATRVKLNP